MPANRAGDQPPRSKHGTGGDDGRTREYDLADTTTHGTNGPGHPAFAERLLAVVPDAQAAARASKNFLARAVRFLLEEAGIRQVRCRDSGRSSRERLCGALGRSG